MENRFGGDRTSRGKFLWTVCNIRWRRLAPGRRRIACRASCTCRSFPPEQINYEFHGVVMARLKRAYGGAGHCRHGVGDSPYARSTRIESRLERRQSSRCKMIFLTRYAPRSVDAARRGGLCVVDRVCKRRQPAASPVPYAKKVAVRASLVRHAANCSASLTESLALAAIAARSASGLRGLCCKSSWP